MDIREYREEPKRRTINSSTDSTRAMCLKPCIGLVESKREGQFSAYRGRLVVGQVAARLCRAEACLFSQSNGGDS